MTIAYVVGLVVGWVVGAGWSGPLARQGRLEGVDLWLAVVGVALGYGLVRWLAG